MEPPDVARLDINQGTDFSAEWWWIADGVGVDFTGCTAFFAPRVVPTDAPLFTVTTTPSAAGQIVLGTAAAQNPGLVLLNLSRLTTAALVVPVIHGDLVIVMSNGAYQEFLEIDGYVHGALFIGCPGPAGWMAAPAGPPGAVGPGVGKTITGPATYQVQLTDQWLRADTTRGDVTFVLPGAGLGSDQVPSTSFTFTLRKGGGNMVIQSPGENIVNPQAPGELVAQLVYTGPGSSVPLNWDPDELEWDPT